MDTACPCKEGRFGSFGIVVAIYWALHCGGLAATLHLAAAGYAVGVWWAIWTGLSAILFLQGIRAALSHDDDVEAGSVLVSVGLLALSFWAITHHWFLLGDNWFYGGADWVAHASFVVWPGLIASEVFNLWLNFRGRRPAVAPMPEPVEVEQPQRSPRFGLRRSRTIKVVENIEGRGIDADDLARLLAHHLGANTLAPPHASPSIGHQGAAPQIVYVPDANGQLIPVALPSPERVRQ